MNLTERLFPLFITSPETAWLLLPMRAAELAMLLFYMRGEDYRFSRRGRAAVLFAAWLLYSVIYELRTDANSLPSLILVSAAHLLIWQAAIQALFRLPAEKCLTVNLMFFLFTRSSRWLFLSVDIMAANFAPFEWPYVVTWLLNLVLELALICLARARLPSALIPSDSKCYVSLSILCVLFIYMRYNFNTDTPDAILTATSFQLTTMLLIYVFVIAMTFALLRISIVDSMRREQERILLVNGARYHELLSRMEAEDDLRRMYHDMRRQLDCIDAMSAEKAGESIRTLRRELDQAAAFADTGNEVLDFILSSRIQQAAKNGVQISCDINMRDIGFIAPMDVCSIFGNALDNAYESVLKVSAPERKVISVKGRHVGSFFAIRISNYYEQPIELKDGRPVTTKSDTRRHGIGISSMEHAVRKYGGSLDIELHDGQIFVLKILIPFPADA